MVRMYVCCAVRRRGLRVPVFSYAVARYAGSYLTVIGTIVTDNLQGQVQGRLHVAMQAFLFQIG